MANPTPHELTNEDRAKGGRNRAERIRQRRAEAEERAAQKLDAALDKAVARYVEALDAGELVVREGDDGEPAVVTDHRTRIQAADRITDRLLGKPTQHTELTGADGGPVVVENDVNADAAETILAGLEAAGLVAGRAANGDAPADEVHPARAD